MNIVYRLYYRKTAILENTNGKIQFWHDFLLCVSSSAGYWRFNDLEHLTGRTSSWQVLQFLCANVYELILMDVENSS